MSPQGRARGMQKTSVRFLFALIIRYSFIFIDLPDADSAAFTINAMNGHPFDARHTFYVNRFIDIEQFANMDETYIAPKLEEYRPKVC